MGHKLVHMLSNLADATAVCQVYAADLNQSKPNPSKRLSEVNAHPE